MTLSSKDYAIHNQMEDLADLAIQQVISEDPDACGCPFCRSDMKCLILNRLQPAYQPVAELDRGPFGPPGRFRTGAIRSNYGRNASRLSAGEVRSPGIRGGNVRLSTMNWRNLS